MGKRTITDVHRRLVAEHLASGKSYAEIAEALSISKGSVANIVKKMREAGGNPAEDGPADSDPGEDPEVEQVVVPDDAPDYDPLEESRRYKFLAQREFAAGRKEQARKYDADARNCYTLWLKIKPPDPVEPDDMPDMIEAAAQARHKMAAQLERSIARAQEPEGDQ
jgi:transposase